jgi:hypothetical protein
MSGTANSKSDLNTSLVIASLTCAAFLVAGNAFAQPTGAQTAHNVVSAEPHGAARVAPLRSPAQALISARLERDMKAYQARPIADGFRMENPRNGLSTQFGSSGVSFRVGTHEWGMKLSGYGYGERLLAANIAAPHARANRMDYTRDELTEWYENGPFGLQQGFTLPRSCWEQEAGSALSHIFLEHPC